MDINKVAHLCDCSIIFHACNKKLWPTGSLMILKLVHTNINMKFSAWSNVACFYDLPFFSLVYERTLFFYLIRPFEQGMMLTYECQSHLTHVCWMKNNGSTCGVCKCKIQSISCKAGNKHSCSMRLFRTISKALLRTNLQRIYRGLFVN